MAHSGQSGLEHIPTGQTGTWQQQIKAVAQRYNREYQRESFDVPPEVEEMPIYQEWASGLLQARLASPFWDLAKPKKNQSCLDLGCGVSFLIYPWTEWQAYFYGQDVSSVAQSTLVARSPQLNSKLFKSAKLAPAHQIDYGDRQFDLVISTGVSCYFDLEYWATVLDAVRKVLKPDGVFVFDVLNGDLPLAENWAILETYLGAEVFLHDLPEWKALIKAKGAKVIKQQSGDLFELMKIKWA